MVGDTGGLDPALAEAWQRTWRRYAGGLNDVAAIYCTRNIGPSRVGVRKADITSFKYVGQLVPIAGVSLSLNR